MVPQLPDPCAVCGAPYTLTAGGRLDIRHDPLQHYAPPQRKRTTHITHTAPPERPDDPLED